LGHETEMRRMRGFGDTNFVLQSRDVARLVGQRAPLPEAAFSFDAQGEHESPWKVRHFTVTEGLSTLYECVVDLAHESVVANPDTLLGRYGLLQVSREPAWRRVFGVIRRVEHRGAVADHRLARVVYGSGALGALAAYGRADRLPV